MFDRKVVKSGDVYLKRLGQFAKYKEWIKNIKAAELPSFQFLKDDETSITFRFHGVTYEIHFSSETDNDGTFTAYKVDPFDPDEREQGKAVYVDSLGNVGLERGNMRTFWNLQDNDSREQILCTLIGLG